MGDFNIGLLSVLEIDTSSSKQSINKSIKALEEQINTVRVEIEADTKNSITSINKAVKSLNANNSLHEIKVALDVDKEKSIKNIKSALSDINKTFKDTVDVQVRTKLDANSLKNVSKAMGNTAKPKDIDIDVKTNLNNDSVNKAKQLEGTYIQLAKQYRNIDELNKVLGKNTDSRLTHEIVGIRNANNELVKYELRLKKINDLGKQIGSQTISYKVNPDQSIGLDKARLADKTDESSKRALEQINKLRDDEISKVNKLVADGKISVAQANELLNKYKAINFEKGKEANFKTTFDKAHKEAQEILNDYKQQNDLLLKQERLIHQIESAERRMADSIDKNTTKRLKQNIAGLNDNGSGKFNKDAAYQLNQFQNEFRGVRAEAERATRSQLGFVESFRQAMIKFPVWMGASTLFFGAIQSGKMFIQTITDIDSKMITLAKVMDSGTNLEAIFMKANDAALQFGQTISGVLDVYAEFARQGIKGDELTQFGNAALIAANVGEIDAKKASEYLTSMSAQWETAGKDAMGQVDSLNEISNKYATTVEKLAQGQAKAGSTAKSMGLTFDETNAVIGTLTAKTKQSGDEIGNFMKATLPKLYNGVGRNTLEGLGINLKDENGNLKSAIALLEEASLKVKDLDKDQRAAVVRGLGGTYHYQRMQVLLEDLGKVDSMYKSIKDTSENSGGSALAENAKYMESMEAKINRAKVAMEQLAVALGDAFLKSGMLDGIRMVTELLAGLTKAITDAGSAAPIIGGLMGALSLFSKNVRTGFEGARQSLAEYIMTQNNLTPIRDDKGMVTGLQNATGQMHQFNKAQKEVSVSALATSGALGRNTASVTANATATRIASGAANAFKNSLRALGSATLVGVAMTGVSIVLEKLINKFNEGQVAIEQFEQQQQQLKTGIESQGAENITKTIDEFKRLQEEVNSGTIDSSGMEKYKNVSNELANLFPDLVSGEGQFGTNVKNNAEVMKNRVAIMEQQLKLQQEINKEEAEKTQLELEKNATKVNKDTFGGGAKNYLSGGNEIDRWKEASKSSASVSEETKAISEQIQKVKDLNSATKAVKDAQDALSVARQEGDKKSIIGLTDQVEVAKNLESTFKKASAATLAAMEGLQTRSATNVSTLIQDNTNLKDSTASVFAVISKSIVGSTTSVDRAKASFTQFEDALKLDDGFRQKMETYTQAVENFKEASKNGGDTTQATEQVRQAYAGLAKEIERVSQSGDSAKVFDKSSEANQLSTALDQLNNEFLEIKDSSKEAANGVDESSQAMQENEEQANATKEANEKLANSMRDIASNHELVGKAIDEMNNGNLSWETMADLAEQYGQEVLALAGNEEALTNFLMAQRDKETQNFKDNMQAKLGASEEYYQAVAGQGTELYNHMKDVYGIDMKNYKTMNKFKAEVGNLWANGTQKQQASLVDAVAKHYGIDVSNFATLAEKKQAVENKLMTVLGEKWKEYINYIAETTNQTFAAIGEEAQLIQAGLSLSTATGAIPAGLGALGNVGIGLMDKVGQMNFALNETFREDAVFQSATAAMTDLTNVAGNLGDGLQNLSDAGDSAGKGLGNTGKAGKSAGKGLKEAANGAKKTAEEAKSAGIEVEKLYKTFQVQTYVADKLALAMDKLNFQLEKQKTTTQKYATWSQKYRDSLKEENKLIDQKNRNLNRQIQLLDQQIKNGKINEYGLVSSDLNVEYYNYKANNLNDGQSARVSYSGATGSTNQQKVWSFLKQKGLTDAQVAGIMGNIEQESRFNPSAEQMKGKFNGGKGLVQWDGARRNQLYDFAKSKGKAWTDIEVQLEFLWKELNSTEAAALTYLRRTTNAVQAAQVFQQKFERAGVPNQGARNSAASKYYNQFKGKSSFVSNGSTTSFNQHAGKGLVDYAGAKLNNDPWGKYAGGGVHYGRDISGAGIGGKSIRAAKDGVVTFAGWTGGGNTISIFDGQNTYTYLHMQKPTPLKKGQVVKAGDVVGKVGTTYGAGGFSTGDHLHVQVNKGKSGTLVNSFTGKNAAIDPKKYGYLNVAGSSSKNFNINTSAGIPYTGNADAAYVEQLNAQEQARLAEIEQAVKANNEAEAMKQKVDEARKKLYDLQLERIKGSSDKSENLYKIHKSSIEQYDHFKELQSAQTAKLQYELNKIEFEKGRNNSSWRKKNSQLQTSKDQEKAWESQKIKYIDRALKDKKLFAKDTVYRDEFEQLRREAEGNVRDIEENKRQILAEIANSLVDEIIEDFDKMNTSFEKQLSDVQRRNSKRDSEKDSDAKAMVKDLQKQSQIYTSKSEQAKFTISQLQAQLKGSKKNAELQKKIKDKINELNNVYADSLVSAHQAVIEAADLDIQRLQNLNAKRLKDGQAKLVKADYDSNFISQEYQIDLYRKNQVDKLKGIRAEKVALEQNKKELEAQYELYKNLPSQAKKIKEAIDETTNSLKENSKNIHVIRQDLANATIQTIKTIYQKQLEVATKAYDKEYSEYEKMINKKLQLIDDESQEETYAKDIKEKTDQLTKLRDEIAQRVGDDSLANQKKLKDLREQLKQQEEDYNAYLTNKAREERKKALQEELSDKNEQINKQKEDLNTAYQDLLENTRLFNSIQETLMQGQMDKYKLMIEDLSKFVNDNMKDIGYSVSQNILDALNTTFTSLQQIKPDLTNENKTTTPVPQSTLKPTVRPEALTSAIKAVNSLTPNAISLATSKIASATLPTNITKPQTVTNNNTQANALVNIENFNGTKSETDKLVGDLKTAMDIQGITL